MKKLSVAAAVAALCIASTGCANRSEVATQEPMKVIFETDLGNDVDDAMALDLMFKYMSEGKIDLVAIMLNKESPFSAEYADILCTWYGHPGIPIGVVRDGADCSQDAVQYAQAVCEMKDAEGKPLFARSMSGYDDLPLAVDLYRKILSEAEDGSITIVSTGFSTNLARLLDTPSDDVSPLTGKELAEKKVALLSTMAGAVANENQPEYNIIKDIPAAKKLFAEWPGKIVDSPFEVGIAIRYPGSSIENDFSWTTAHPVVEAYKVYNKMPYDEPTWDITSFLYVVEGLGTPENSLFSIVGPCTLEANDLGGMRFTPQESGNRYYLTVDSTQAAAVLDRFLEILPKEPAR